MGIPLFLPLPTDQAYANWVDHAYLSGRVKALQRELAEITEHNRQYFTKKHHSPKDRAQHEELWERVYEIRAELYALMERTAA